MVAALNFEIWQRKYTVVTMKELSVKCVLFFSHNKNSRQIIAIRMWEGLVAMLKVAHEPITVGPYHFTHTVNFHCGRKPEYPNVSQDFRQNH